MDNLTTIGIISQPEALFAFDMEIGSESDDDEPIMSLYPCNPHGLCSFNKMTKSIALNYNSIGIDLN
jgi:hypothetical protein